MCALRLHSTRASFGCFAFAVFVGTMSSFAQDGESSITPLRLAQSGTVDVRYGPEMLEVDGRAMLSQWMSADGSITTDGLRAGISVYPLSLIFAQLWAGQGRSHIQATDVAPFEPDYFAGWRVGARMPLGRSRFHLSIAFGNGWTVQERYNTNSGLFPAGHDATPHYVRRVESGMTFTGGVGVHF